MKCTKVIIAQIQIFKHTALSTNCPFQKNSKKSPKANWTEFPNQIKRANWMSKQLSKDIKTSTSTKDYQKGCQRSTICRKSGKKEIRSMQGKTTSASIFKNIIIFLGQLPFQNIRTNLSNKMLCLICQERERREKEKKRLTGFRLEAWGI